METADAELVVRIHKGDKAAYRELARRYADRLFALAYAMLGSAADAEDVVQETMLAVLTGGAGRFKGRSSVATWLRSILIFQASKLRRARRVPQARPIDPVIGSPSDDLWEPSSDPIAAAERKLDVSEMLGSLPAEHREVLVLRELEQMSYEQIAAALGIPIGTVESRLYRARQALRLRFASYAQ